jgi:predicted MFS family arabinose efflux permease
MDGMVKSARGAWVALAAGFFVLFVGGGARFAIGLTLKPMVDEFGWDRTQIGLAVAVFQVVSAVCMFLAGRLADRFSHRLVLGVGLVLGGVGIGAMSLVETPWQAILFFGVVFAIGSGVASTTTVSVMVTRAFPARTGLANGFVTSGTSMGQVVTIGAMAALMAQIGWRGVFLSLGLIYAAVVPLLLFAIPGAGAAPAQRRPAEGASLAKAARTRAFWLLMLVYGVCGFDDFFVATHVVAFAQDRGVDAFLAGNLLAAMGLAAWLGVLGAGGWGDRAGPAPVTALSFALRIAVFGLIALDQSPLSVAVFALVFGATFFMTAPLTVLFVRDAFGLRNLGALTGLITMVHHIFGGLGAWLGARIFDATGNYDAAFRIMFAASCVALAASLALRGARQSGRP